MSLFNIIISCKIELSQTALVDNLFVLSLSVGELEWAIEAGCSRKVNHHHIGIANVYGIHAITHTATNGFYLEGSLPAHTLMAVSFFTHRVAALNVVIYRVEPSWSIALYLQSVVGNLGCESQLALHSYVEADFSGLVGLKTHYHHAVGCRYEGCAGIFHTFFQKAHLSCGIGKRKFAAVALHIVRCRKQLRYA